MNCLKISLLVCFLYLALGASAQRYAVIDVKYILEKMPEYQQAKNKLDTLIIGWQQEIKEKQKTLDSLSKNFEAEKYMLNDELKAKRSLQISNYTQEIADMEKKYFGFEGELFKQKANLLRPIQDKLLSTVQTMAVSRKWDYVLDKSAGTAVFYADPKLNKSDEVVKALSNDK